MTDTDLAPRLRLMFRSVLVLTSGNYGAMALSLVISVVVTRRLGTEQFGRLALLLMASQIFILLVTNWTQAGLIRFGAKEFAATGRTADVFWARTWLVLPFAVLACVAIVVFRPWLSVYFGVPAWGIFVVLLHIAAAYATATFGAVFQAREHMHPYSVSLVLEKAILLAAVAMLPAVFMHNALAVLVTYAAASLITSAWSLYRIGPRSLLPVTLNRETCRVLLSFSLPLILSSWAGLLGASWLSLIVIKWYRPLSDVGAYSLATQLAGVVQQVAIIVSTVLLPRLSVLIASGEDEKVRVVVRRVFPYWLLGTSILFCGVIAGMRPMLAVVFGPAYQHAAVPLAILMPASSAVALFASFSPIVTAYGATWPFTWACLLAAGVNVVMALLLVPPFGIAGAAAATMLSYATSAALVLVLAQRRMGERFVSLTWLIAPVPLVCIAFLSMSNWLFYWVAVPAAALACYGLARAFGLLNTSFLSLLRVVPVEESPAAATWARSVKGPV